MEQTQGWHLDRRISIGHLVTTATLLVAMMLWAGRMDTRISLLEVSLTRQVAVDRRQDEATQRLREEIREELRSLNEKMDRYLGERSKPRGGSLPTTRATGGPARGTA
jgi:hypothetical protein